MADTDDVHQAGDRIERLLEEIRSMASPSAWQRVDELMRAVVDLYGTGLGRVLEVLSEEGEAGSRIERRLADDDLVASLLILHGLHPDSLAARVQGALEGVRPYLGSHGGDVEIVEIDETAGAVRLRMKGSCDGCPSSLLTVKLAVESAIRERAPEVGTVEVQGVTTPRAGTAAGEIASAAVDAEPACGWVPIVVNGPSPGQLDVYEVEGSRMVVCRVNGLLYAYRDRCPSCDSSMEHATLDGATLACPSCKRGYDVCLAGRATDGGTEHLIPIPLLEDDSGVRMAIGEPPP